MDAVTAPDRAATLSFGPDRRLTGLAAAGLVIAVVLALTTSDRPGAALFGVAAVVLAGYVLADLAFSKRLVADRRGIRIRTPLTRIDLSWAEIEAVRVDARQRLGLRSVTLEVDAGATLVVFSRRSLGADPEQVCALVLAVAPPG